MSWKKLILLNIILLIIGFVGLIWGTDYMRERQVIQDEKRRLDLYSKILDGASTGPSQMTIDYSKQISTGSPLIFGGSNPGIRASDVWEQFSEVGITAVRVPLFVEFSVPTNSSIDNYKSNLNNIQDPNNWNLKVMDQQSNILKNAKANGMKTLAVMEFSPAWLNYSNTPKSMPKDMTIYKDIVQKLYARNRNYIDYIEIWNEPDWDFFLDLKNTGLTREESYMNIYLNAAKAINDYDKQINDGKYAKIGGPVLSKVENTKILKYILESSEIRKYLDFISFHNYDIHSPLDIAEIQSLIKINKADNLPKFLTEWNYTPDEKVAVSQLVSNESILYTAMQFLKIIKQDIDSAFYFALQPVETKKIGLGHGYLAFYEKIGDTTELLPMAKTWRILSKQMKLGKGESAIFGTKINLEQKTENSENSLMGLVNQMLEPEKTNSIGFKNIDGEYGVAMVNSSDQSFVLDTTLEKTSLKSFTKVRVYYASAGNDAKTPVYEGELKADKNGTIRFPFLIPRETVVGMVFVEDKAWYEGIFN